VSKQCSADSYRSEVQSAVCRIQLTTAAQSFVKIHLQTNRGEYINLLCGRALSLYTAELLVSIWLISHYNDRLKGVGGLCYLSPPNVLGVVSFDCFHDVDGLSEHVLVNTKAVSGRHGVHAPPIYHLYYTAQVRTNENIIKASVAISAYSMNVMTSQASNTGNLFAFRYVSSSGNEY